MMFIFVLLPLAYLASLASAKYTCNEANANNINDLLPDSGNSASSGSSYSGDSGAGFTPSLGPAIENIGIRVANSADFECDDTEACILGYGFLLCVDRSTYDFEDTYGGKGNLESDVYTMKNGQETTIAETATALPTVGATNTASTATGSGVATTSANAAASGRRKTGGAAELGMLAAVLGAIGAVY
jgi:hypothetical protein